MSKNWSANLAKTCRSFPATFRSDEEIATFFQKVRGQTDRLDLLLHSVAFAPKEALEGDFVSTTREAFRTRARHQRLFVCRAGARSRAAHDGGREHCGDDLLRR